MSPNIDGLPLKDVSLPTLMMIILTSNIQLISDCIRFKHHAKLYVLAAVSFWNNVEEIYPNALSGNCVSNYSS